MFITVILYFRSVETLRNGQYVSHDVIDGMTYYLQTTSQYKASTSLVNRSITAAILSSTNDMDHTVECPESVGVTDEVVLIGFVANRSVLFHVDKTDKTFKVYNSFLDPQNQRPDYLECMNRVCKWIDTGTADHAPASQNSKIWKLDTNYDFPIAHVGTDSSVLMLFQAQHIMSYGNNVNMDPIPQDARTLLFNCLCPNVCH